MANLPDAGCPLIPLLLGDPGASLDVLGRLFPLSQLPEDVDWFVVDGDPIASVGCPVGPGFRNVGTVCVGALDPDDLIGQIDAMLPQEGLVFVPDQLDLGEIVVALGSL
jgi:hypothetical protein